MTSFLLRTLALSLLLAMALSRNLLQSNWSAMLRLTQGSQKEVNLELRFPHTSSWQINHLRRNCLEESARMAQSSR
ncbi:hypothetical protein [Xanthomonas campestris]|uniref:hypothetical protein n=1 Tax=Xanthomonas campestris TaxID=339 RepID=UPI00388DC251